MSSANPPSEKLNVWGVATNAQNAGAPCAQDRQTSRCAARIPLLAEVSARRRRPPGTSWRRSGRRFLDHPGQTPVRVASASAPTRPMNSVFTSVVAMPTWLTAITIANPHTATRAMAASTSDCPASLVTTKQGAPELAQRPGREAGVRFCCTRRTYLSGQRVPPAPSKLPKTIRQHW